jgi:hypothetical protein
MDRRIRSVGQTSGQKRHHQGNGYQEREEKIKDRCKSWISAHACTKVAGNDSGCIKLDRRFAYLTVRLCSGDALFSKSTGQMVKGLNSYGDRRFLSSPKRRSHSWVYATKNPRRVVLGAIEKLAPGA